MPRNRRKRPAGPVTREILEVVSPGGVEFTSLSILGGKVIKKRVIERVPFSISAPSNDTPPLDDILPLDDTLPPNGTLPPDDTNDKTPNTRNPKGPSRSGSVSDFYKP